MWAYGPNGWHPRVLNDLAEVLTEPLDIIFETRGGLIRRNINSLGYAEGTALAKWQNVKRN